ncbi:MAG TPA: hypothetical protein VN317_10945, partial [Candidatus Methanoperedens sp.]|nr:hypothetical protein [Candidatus Methanoperedens sp.]
MERHVPSRAGRPPGRGRGAPLLGAFLVGLVALAVYAPAIRGEFVLYDDYQYIVDNPFVRQGMTIESVRAAVSRFHLGTWQPAVWLSFMLDAELFGLDAHGFHLVNVLLHAANTVLLFALLRLLTGALLPAVLTALLFSLHPLRVESVAWVSQRKDLLAAF